MKIEDILSKLSQGDEVRVSYKPFLDLGPLSGHTFTGQYQGYKPKKERMVFERTVLDLGFVGIKVNWPIKTKDIKQHTLSADIIMTATGVPDLIKKDMVKEGAIVVDVGISKINGKIKGDVEFDNVKYKCSYITPVTGGMKPMTILSLIENLLELKSKY